MLCFLLYHPSHLIEKSKSEFNKKNHFTGNTKKDMNTREKKTSLQ